MWEIDPGNLRAAMARADVNQSQLAKAVGVQQPSIGRLLSGATKTTRAIEAIAKKLETSPAYLRGESDDPTPVSGHGLGDPPSSSRFVELDDGKVEIAEIDLAFGMGGTFLDDGAVNEKLQPFPRDWLSMYTDTHPENLFFARGRGDSMMPTIADGDIVLIDRSQRRIMMRDEMWAATVGGVGMIKRLRNQSDGSVRILSDNPMVPEDRAVDDELFLIGRVVAIVRKV